VKMVANRTAESVNREINAARAAGTPIELPSAREFAPRSARGFGDRVERTFSPFLGKDNLSLGCALNHEPGFTNLDCDSRARPDVLHNMEVTPLPFPDNSFDCVLASHSLEHVLNLIPLVADVHRILRPNGYFLAVTPHAACNMAWDSPHHVRGFTEGTWVYFQRSTYENVHAGYGAYQGGDYRDWNIIQIALVPFPEFRDDPDLDYKVKHLRNVVHEVQAVLQAVKK